jgi:simple sugar transport system substrate-binding protein
MKLLYIFFITVVLSFSTSVFSKPVYKFITHASVGASSAVFWQVVHRGMKDACERFDVDCQMVFLQSEDGNVGEQVANFNQAIAAGADNIATTIYDDMAFDDSIDEALSLGINVLGFTVDDVNTPNNRQAFIGQDLEAAGYALMVDLEKNFLPKEGPLHILVGVNSPGHGWSEARTGGEIRRIEEMIANEPDRDISYATIDAGMTDTDVGNRASAYILANPKTNVYVSSGLWGPGLATMLEENGYNAGDIIIGGFDVVPSVVDCIISGWCHATVDQQPYLQGYLPVVQFFLKDAYGLGYWDVNTGALMLHKEDMAALEEYSKAGYR